MGEGEVYLMYINEESAYKIGVSKNSKKRIKQLQTGCPYMIELRSVFKSKYSYKVEKVLHRRYASYKLDSEEIKMYGEWYALGFRTNEMFQLECRTIEENIDFLFEAGNNFISNR